MRDKTERAYAVVLLTFGLCLARILYNQERVVEAVASAPRDFIVLRWSDVPDEYTAVREIDMRTGKLESPEAFAARVIVLDRLMHGMFLSLKGK